MVKGEPINILLVEDDMAHAEIVRRNLAEFRVANRIVHVTDGQEALDFLFHEGAYADPAINPRPDIVLLDLRLPKVDGLEVLRRIKEDPDLKTVPTVVLTTSAAEADMVERVRRGGRQLPGEAGRLREVHRADGRLRVLLAGVEQLPALNGTGPSDRPCPVRAAPGRRTFPRRGDPASLRGPAPGSSVEVAGSLREYREVVTIRPPDIAIIDLNLPDGSAVEVLTAPAEAGPFPIVVMTSYGDQHTAVEAMKSGALDYVVKSPETFADLPRIANGAMREWGLLQARKQAEKVLGRTLAMQEAIFEGSRDAIFISDDQSRFVAVNAAASELTGYSVEELLSMRIPDLHEQGDRHAYDTYHDAIMAGTGVLSEAPTLRKDGRKVDTEFSSRRIVVDGKPLMHTTARDITERKEAERARLESERRYQSLLDHAGAGIGYWSPDGRLLMVNSVAARTLGSPPEALVGRSVLELFDRSTAEETLSRIRRAAATGTPATYEDLVPLQEVERWFVSTYSRIADDTGTALGVEIISQEITERKRAEAAVREAETRYRLLFEQSPDGILIVDPETARPLEFNETAHRQLGYSREEFARLSIADIEDVESPDETRATIAKVIREGRHDFETRHRTREGEIRDVLVTAQLSELLGQSVYHCIWRDVTERKRAEDALRESERRFVLFMQNLPGVAVIRDLDGRYVYMNEAWDRAMSLRRQDFIGKTSFECFPREDALRLVEDDRRLVASGGTQVMEVELHHASGPRWWLVNRFLLEDKDGRPTHVAALYVDITERKQAERRWSTAGRSSCRRRRWRRWGGWRAGWRTTSTTSCRRCCRCPRCCASGRIRRSWSRRAIEIEAQIRRGASLTQQLLLFSRRKEVEKKRIDLGEVVGAAGVMLRRLIPENIRLTVEIAPQKLWVDGDVGQVQQILMNLAVNARDAMPAGGTLTVRAGGEDEAWVEVEDDGAGMNEEVRQHLFEPFFTTKEPGKGTGLGLSVVHGIASSTAAASRSTAPRIRAAGSASRSRRRRRGDPAAKEPSGEA